MALRPSYLGHWPRLAAPSKSVYTLQLVVQRNVLNSIGCPEEWRMVCADARWLATRSSTTVVMGRCCTHYTVHQCQHPDISIQHPATGKAGRDKHAANLTPYVH